MSTALGTLAPPHLATPAVHVERRSGGLLRLVRGKEILTLSRVLIALAIVLWIASLPSLRTAPSSTYGLLASGSALFPIAALLTVAAFCSAVRRGRLGDAIAALLAWIAVVRVTVSVITPLPIYTWTYKHIGVADYIEQTGHTASSVDIYMAWPGAFSAFAWFHETTGISVLALAQWFAVGVHLLIALGIFAMSRAAGQSRMVAVTAAFLAEVVNWVGQDYLSPQAIAFVLSIQVLALLVRARTSRAAAWFSVPVFAAIVIAHQLTPYWLLLIALALGVGKALRTRWIGVGYAVIALGYLAWHLRIAGQYGLVSGFNPLGNAASNVISAGSPGHDFTSAMVRIPAVLLWGCALVVTVVQVRRFLRARRQDKSTKLPVQVWVPVVMAFSSFTLLVGQSYGGEAIFRVFLYSLPGCVLLVAPVVVHGLLSARGTAAAIRLRLLRGTTALAVVVLAAASLQGYYGGWFTNLVRADSLAAVEHLLDTAPTDSLILPVTSGIPERPVARYVQFAQTQKYFDAPVQLLPGVRPDLATGTSLARLLEQLEGNVPGPVYVILTQQMRDYSAYYGIYRPGVLDDLVTRLRADGHWQPVTDTATLQIFRLVGSTS